MNTKSIIAVALAALLVFAGGAAAMPGNAPDDPGSDAADDHAPDDPDADASNETDDANESEADGNMTDAEDRDENATDGPPTDMPEPVPDHVSKIHQLIRDKLAGELTGMELGEAISGLVGGSDEAQANSQADSAGEQSENATDNAANQSEDARSNADNAGPTGDLPDQAANHVGAIHDAIMSFLNGGDDGNPGDAVSSAAR